MLTCKSVARTLADREWADLPRWRRAGLHLHLLLCVVCGRYHRGVLRLQRGVRRYRDIEASDAGRASALPSLHGAERDAMRARLRAAIADGDTPDRSLPPRD